MYFRFFKEKTMTGTYLMFNRNCRDALALYEKAFDAKVREMMTYGDMPPNPSFPVQERDRKLVLHARFEVDGSEIMCADSSSGVETGSNMYITVSSKDGAMVKKAWDILKTGGKVYMDLQPSFFALLHGSLRDAYGVNWMFTVEKTATSP